MPVSRYTETKKDDILSKNLDLLSYSDDTGVGIVQFAKSKDLFILNHLEYDSDTLKEEHLRDIKDQTEVKFPLNYYPENDFKHYPLNTWRPYAFLLFSNFINEVYQDAPFNLKEIL